MKQNLKRLTVLQMMEVNLANKFAYPKEDDERFAYTHLSPNGYEKKFIRNSPKNSIC